MATDAVGGGPLESSADVTGDAVQSGVHTGERETRKPCVIERRAEPGVHGVALLASRRQSRRAVIQDGRLQKGLGVAGDALCRETLELAGRCALVAGVTGNRRVCADQGESILVIAHRLQGDLPPLHRVALLALRAELAAVNVGVTVRAFGSDVREHEADMTLCAGNSLVQATQRVMRLVMIELHDIAQRFPRCERVTILAGDRQISMRAARGTTLIGLLRGHKSSRHQQ